MIFHILPNASHCASSGGTKSAMPLNSTPASGKSSITMSFLLYQAKKSAVKWKAKGSFPNWGERLIHLSIRGSDVGHVINVTYGFICGSHSKKK